MKQQPPCHVTGIPARPPNTRDNAGNRRIGQPITRNICVTVRLPGASTAPATRTSTWFQTGAVKHGRNTASQAARTGGPEAIRAPRRRQGDSLPSRL